jgi:hypothetical protein
MPCSPFLWNVASLSTNYTVLCISRRNSSFILIYIPSLYNLDNVSGVKLTKTRNSGKNELPTFIWYDMDRTANGVSKLFHCCLCIRCRGNISIELLPSNDRGLHIQTHRLMGRIHEVRSSDAIMCHVIYTKFHIDWLRHSKVVSCGTYIQTHSMLFS